MWTASDRAIDAIADTQKTRPRRRRLPPDLGEQQVAAVSLRTCSTAASRRPLPTANGSLTSPMCGLRRAGSM